MRQKAEEKLHGRKVGKVEDKEGFALFCEEVYGVAGFGLLLDFVIDAQLAEQVCGRWRDE